MTVRTILASVLLGLSCWSSATIADQPAAQVEMGGIRQTRYDRSGKLAAVIRAELAAVDDEGMLVMERVTATVYTEDGKEIEFRASKGRADTGGTGDAVFEGDLELSFSDFVVTTTRAIWRELDRTVRGDDTVVLQSGESRIVGSGFVVFTSSEKAIVYRPRGTVRLENAKESPRRDSATAENHRVSPPSHRANNRTRNR